MSRVLVRRRDLLAGLGLIGAAGALGYRHVAGRGRAQVVIFEGDRPVARALARTGGFSARRIDLSAESATHWRSLRSLGKGLAVAGFTGWDAYVAARGLLEGQGLRLVSEAVDRKRGLVAWRMA
jgi:hypothetical protein